MTAPTDNPRHVRTIFLSDFHMGFKGFDAVSCNNFLQNHECKIIYLLGDIFDGWKLEKRWYWNQDYTDLIDTLVEKQKQGVKIFFCPGNHDEKLRDYLIIPIRYFFAKKFGIKIDNHFVHIANDCKKYLTLHGDQFDSMLVRGTSKTADRIYGWFVEKSIIPPRIEKTIKNGRRKPWSLGKAISKGGTNLLNRLTEAAALRVTEEKTDGIIYGHSHVPMLEIKNNKTIANCGSWTISSKQANAHTALIENNDGSIEMVEWPMMRRDRTHEKSQSIEVRDIKSKHPETKQIAKIVHDLWCKPSAKHRLQHI